MAPRALPSGSGSAGVCPAPTERMKLRVGHSHGADRLVWCADSPKRVQIFRRGDSLAKELLDFEKIDNSGAWVVIARLRKQDQ
jgi:hypothetical protein